MEHKENMQVLGSGTAVEFVDEVIEKFVDRFVLLRVGEGEHNHLGDKQGDRLPADVGIDLFGQVQRVEGIDGSQRSVGMDGIGQFDDGKRLVGGFDLMLAVRAIQLQRKTTFRLTVHFEHRHLVGVLLES